METSRGGAGAPSESGKVEADVTGSLKITPEPPTEQWSGDLTLSRLGR